MAFLSILVVFAVLSGALWFFLHDDEDDRRAFEGVAEILGKALPSPDRPVAELEHALARLHTQFGIDLKLSRTDGEPIAAAGEPIGAPPTEGWQRRGRRNSFGRRGREALGRRPGSGRTRSGRERIFEPFDRSAGMREGADGGVGLGLALVRQIARHHHGEACCLERVGGGTRLEITLRSP